jgi:hypothetical protein
MIEFAAGRLLDGLRLIPVLASLKKLMSVWDVRMPLDRRSELGADEVVDFSDKSRSWVVLTVNINGMLRSSINTLWPGANI